ncbi:MAG: TldD/PmbA family protein [Clostridia bacterium]|nr:TldD/PmbA family protein [Clostridia bacterium]
MIKQDLSKYVSQLEKYSELRVQENRSFTMAYMNGNLVRNDKSATGGVSARVFKDGKWGFASQAEISEETINKVIESATKNATFLASKAEVSQAPFESDKVEESHDYSTNQRRWTQDEVTEYLKSVDDYISSTYPDLVSRTVVLSCLEMEKNTITSDGTKSYWLWPRTVFYVGMNTQNEGVPCELGEVFGGRGHFEEHLTTVDDVKDKIDQLYADLMKKNEGVDAIAGLHDVILDADLAGILAHEAFGHTVEADLVRNGSIAGDYLNKQVASPLVSLIDFAHSYNDELLPVPVHVDDEGVVCKDAVIIENGILKQFMHNRDSAFEFNHENTGNARAWEYKDEPLIRMRNTAILPGESSLEEMIASIEDGYYFKKTSNGQADTTGEFMFGVAEGYEIKNGKLGKAIKNTTISGRAFEVLSSVTMVSNEMKWSAAGMCGKKQPIPVGMGGPAIKCKINVGGK